MFSRCLPLLLLFVTPAAALGTGCPIKVPNDFATIQAAVNAAADGDIIEVSAGHYLESVVIEGFTGLVLRGKGKVVIHGTGDAALTLLECTDCVVDKIRVEGGPGHGIRLQFSERCTVSRCRIADVAGDVVVLLFEDTAGLAGTGSYEGCTNGVKKKLIKKIGKKPDRFYVNIHTKEFPDGEIRGQLEPVK